MDKSRSIRRNEEQWRQIIAAQEASGQPVTAYCREKNLSDKNFYFWRRRLRGRPQMRSETFLEVVSASDGPGHKCVLLVHTPGGYRLEIPRGLDVETIRTVLQALEMK